MRIEREQFIFVWVEKIRHLCYFNNCRSRTLMWKEAKRSKLRRECRELVESFCCAEGDGTRHHIRRSASRLSSAGESGSLTIRKIGAFRRRRALTRCGWKEWGRGKSGGWRNGSSCPCLPPGIGVSAWIPVLLQAGCRWARWRPCTVHVIA